MLRFLKGFLQSNPSFQPLVAKIKFVVRAAFAKSMGASAHNALQDSQDFLFIVGCGRSGNTLLRRLLMERFDIYIPPESYVLPRQIEQYYLNPGLHWVEKANLVLALLESHPEFKTFGIDSLDGFRQRVKEMPESDRTFEALISSLYHWMASEQGIDSHWVGDKTPLNTLHLGIISAAFPNAKYIFLERDPVDVIQSYLQAGIYKHPKDAALRWKASLRAWQRFNHRGEQANRLEVKYEDLVSKPDQVLDLIGRRYGLPKRDLKRGFDPAELGDVALHAHHSNARKTPMTSSIGKGRREASPTRLVELRKILGKLPESRGYREL